MSVIEWRNFIRFTSLPRDAHLSIIPRKRLSVYPDMSSVLYQSFKNIAIPSIRWGQAKNVTISVHESNSHHCACDLHKPLGADAKPKSSILFLCSSIGNDMKLRANVAAPPFNLLDIYGRTVDLEQYRDSKILIGFFRHAGCPFCNLRVHALTKIHTEMLGKGLKMIFFFESKGSLLLRSSFHQEVSPIPLIADPEKKWYQAYGLEPSLGKSAISHITSFVQTAMKASSVGVPMHMMKSGESFSTLPAEFLIKEGLIIHDVHYSERLNDRLSVDAIRAFVR